jgi:MFS family permease
MPTSPSRGSRAARETVWSRGIVVLLACVVLGWTAEGMIQPTLPLLILDRGGDAVTVGLVAALFAVPSLVLRPFIGRRMDKAGHGGLHQLGTILASLAPLAYLVPGLVMVPAGRLVQGMGWAMFGTANNVVLARLAPPARRGEASGYFNVAYAAGWLVGPPVGLFLYAAAGAGATYLTASAIGILTLVTVTALRRIASAPAPDPAGPGLGRGGERSPGDARGTIVARSSVPASPAAAGAASTDRPRSRLGRGYLEPTAIPTMLVTATFMGSQALFVSFAPVYARAIDAPLEWLTVYFPLYGILLMISQLGAGRISDRFGRRAAVVGGALLGTAGLLVAFLPFGFVGFTVGAAAYGVAAGIVTPATAAATMDRAPAGRLGASMATFSMSYQLAAGAGGALWGVIIATLGFPWPFLIGMVFTLASIGLAVRHLPGRRPAGA